MAMAVAHTLEHGGSLVVEAGTGVGKTFAYLVPALLSRERVLLNLWVEVEHQSELVVARRFKCEHLWCDGLL